MKKKVSKRSSLSSGKQNSVKINPKKEIKLAPKNTLDSHERYLSVEPYWIEVAVQVGVRYKISGYIRSENGENKDAALILFDFGGYQMDVEQLKMYDLKHSGVGTYAYLPINAGGVSVWSYDIPIAEKMSKLKIGFRTWKNEHSIILSRKIQVKKDISFAKNHNELQRTVEQNRYLHIALLKEKQAVIKVKKMLSFQLGYLLVHSTKSWKNFFRLPYDLYYLSQNWKFTEIQSDHDSSMENLDWRDITDQPFSKIIQVLPNNEIELKGKIVTQEGEKQFAALIQINFLGVTVAKESAQRLGLKYSDKIGFYEYLPTEEAGEHDWNIKFRVPDFCKKIKLTLLPWFSNGAIEVCLLEESSKEKAKPKVEQTYIDEITSIFVQKGLVDAEAYIVKGSLSLYHQSDLYEVLASLTIVPAESSRYYLQSYTLDPSYFRAVKMFRRVVDGGFLQTAKNILQDFEQKKHIVLPADFRNVMYAKGYVSLYEKMPTLSGGLVRPIFDNTYKTMMFLHTSLPHHSNGYATRSHAILTSMLKSSKYTVEGVTRSGYPMDVGIKEFNAFDEVDGVRYSRLTSAHYYDQPLDTYMQTAADEIEEKLREERPSVVHAASAFYTAIPALIAARRLGIPFVYEVRGLWEITRGSTIPGWRGTERFDLESALEASVAKEADQVIAITGGIKEELIKRGVNAEKISIIPNAINKNHFQPLIPNEELRAKIGLKNVLTIGYVGSIVWYEGLEDLLDALVILKTKGVAFNFLLIGDGSALAAIKQKVANLSIKGDVYILGRIPHEEVPDYYSLIDVTPFPRKSLEVCEMVSPLKPFEAMAQEKAVIASDVGALKEIIEDQKTGLLFEKDNIEDLAAKLELLLTDEVLRDRIAKEGKKWVLSHRDWSQIAPRFDIVYDKAFQVNEERLCAKIKELETIRPLSLLVYGDLNLNYVDGSAIWACSLVEMLAGFKNTSVTFLLKADLTHDTLIKSLKKMHNVKIIVPSATSKHMKLLKPVDAIDLLEELQLQNSYDGVILRGFALNKLAAAKKVFRGRLWSYMVDVFQRKDEWDEKIIEELTQVVKASYTVFCQTTYIEEFIESKIPEAKGKTSLLPPMVPDQSEPKKQFDIDKRAFKIVYAGKFAPLWGTREMLLTFKALRKKGLNVELHVYGDKIHNPPEDKTFKSEVEAALNNTEGLIWHKAKPRAEVIEAMRTYDLAWAWRRPELEENTDEISTKFLEYSSVGLPMLVIGNKITTKLLTKDYPLFVNSFDQLVPTIRKIISNPEMIKQASALVYSASKEFSFSAVRENYIDALVEPLHSREKSKTILFAGHDLKFVDKLMDKFAAGGYTVLTDKWQGHNKHDEAKSKELLLRADIIYCEWAMGNAVWYSHNKLPFQKMFIRLHLQEIDTEFPANINYDAIDKLVFISPFIQREVVKKFSLQEFNEKIAYIPNYVETEKLNQSKNDDARFNLGIVGIVPERKRFDRALDILENLRKKDKRYQLFIKGKVAKEYSWMLSRPEEMKYYEELEKRIENSPYLQGAVHYDGFGKDMGAWFSKIGYILSTSDFEGSHLSVAEAMASGSSPVIIKWDGADEIYPKKYCFDKITQAVKYVLNETDESFAEHMVENKVFVEEFDIDNIYKVWKGQVL